MKTGVAKLTRKFQITIPAAVRKRLVLEPGDRVWFEVDGDRVVLSVIPGSFTEHVCGLGAEMWRAAGGVRKVIEEERRSWGDE